MAVNLKRISKAAFKILDTVVDGSGTELTTWIVLVQTVYLRRQISPRRKNTDRVKISHPKQNTLSFVQILSQGNRLGLKLFCITAIKASTNIDRGEELYSIYGSDYTFPSVTSNTKGL